MNDTFATRIRSSWIEANPTLQQGVESFYKQREEGEFDLVAKCRELMLSKGLEEQVLSAWDTDSNIIEAAPLCFASQRFIINKYWQLQLFTLEKDTQKERFCLIDKGEPKDWVKCFTDVILPRVVAEGLPRVL